jgi:hypothetical protein
VVDGTSRLPQSKIEQAVQSNMIFKVYNPIDIANLANAAYQGNLSYQVQVLLPTSGTAETLEAVDQDGNDLARLSEKLFKGTSAGGSAFFKVKGIHYDYSHQSHNHGCAPAEGALDPVQAVLEALKICPALDRESHPILYWSHLQKAEDRKELNTRLEQLNSLGVEAMLDITEVLMNRSSALLAPIRAVSEKQKGWQVQTRSARQEYKLESEFVAPCISDVYLVHGTIERKANKQCPGNGSSKLDALTEQCAQLTSLINKANDIAIHPSVIAQKAEEAIQPAIQLALLKKIQDFNGLTEELGDQTEAKLKQFINLFKSKLENDIPTDHQFDVQVQRTLVASFEMQLLARMTPVDDSQFDCSLHLPMDEHAAFEIRGITSPVIEPMELIAQIYNGRHGMLYDMVHANEAIEYILDMDDCMWRRCLTIKPLTASEFGRSTMSSSIKAIVQGTDIVRNNIRYLGQNYRIPQQGY